MIFRGSPFHIIPAQHAFSNQKRGYFLLVNENPVIAQYVWSVDAFGVSEDDQCMVV
jgi:hypothetical protein